MSDIEKLMNRIDDAWIAVWIMFDSVVVNEIYLQWKEAREVRA